MEGHRDFVYLKIFISNIICAADKKIRSSKKNCRSDKDDYTFDIGETIYDSKDVDENTSYVFSILTFMNFFISIYEENNNELMENYYFFRIFKDTIQNYVRQSICFNQLLLIFENFWSKNNLYSFLIMSINGIEESLKHKMIGSIEYVITNYDIFLVELCKCNVNIFNILGLNNVEIKFILKNNDEKDTDEEEEVNDVAKMLLSLGK
jgi:hypothetical protein